MFGVKIVGTSSFVPFKWVQNLSDLFLSERCKVIHWERTEGMELLLNGERVIVEVWRRGKVCEVASPCLRYGMPFKVVPPTWSTEVGSAAPPLALLTWWNSRPVSLDSRSKLQKKASIWFCWCLCRRALKAALASFLAGFRWLLRRPALTHS